MDNENKEVEKEVVPETKPTGDVETQTPAPSQEEDPVKAELDSIDTKKRTKLEKLQYTKQRIDEQIAAEKVASGVVEDEDDKPLTIGEFKRLRAQEGLESAIELADKIEDPNERKLAKHYLENNIRPSGDAKDDLRLALAMVNAVKNGQIAEEAVRTVTPRTTTSTAGAPAKEKPTTVDLSKEDSAIARGFGLTEEEVAKATQQ